jgi:hypothetical protein
MIIIAYAMGKYRLFAITPSVAGQEILSSLGRSIVVVDLSGRIMSSFGDDISKLVELDKVIDRLMKKGKLHAYKITGKDKTVSVSARLLQAGGAAVLIFHDLTAVETIAEEERVTHLQLNRNLQRERDIHQFLTRIASSNNSAGLEKVLSEAKQIFAGDPEAIEVIASTSRRASEKMELLRELEANNISLPAKLSEIALFNKESVQRELKMIDLKNKIQNLKNGKGIR